MENFLKIISTPDNIAILIMLGLVISVCVMAYREIRANDKLIAAGKKDEVYKRMCE